MDSMLSGIHCSASPFMGHRGAHLSYRSVWRVLDRFSWGVAAISVTARGPGERRLSWFRLRDLSFQRSQTHKTFDVCEFINHSVDIEVPVIDWSAAQNSARNLSPSPHKNTAFDMVWVGAILWRSRCRLLAGQGSRKIRTIGSEAAS